MSTDKIMRAFHYALRNFPGDGAAARDEMQFFSIEELQEVREGAQRLAKQAKTEIDIINATP